MGYDGQWRRNEDTSKNAPLSPPLAKASASVSALAEAYFKGSLKLRENPQFSFFYNWNWLGNHRENNEEGSTHPGNGLDIHTPLMRLHDGFDDRQPQAGS